MTGVWNADRLDKGMPACSKPPVPPYGLALRPQISGPSPGVSKSVTLTQSLGLSTCASRCPSLKSRKQASYHVTD